MLGVAVRLLVRALMVERVWRGCLALLPPLAPTQAVAISRLEVVVLVAQVAVVAAIQVGCPTQVAVAAAKPAPHLFLHPTVVQGSSSSDTR